MTVGPSLPRTLRFPDAGGRGTLGSDAARAGTSGGGLPGLRETGRAAPLPGCRARGVRPLPGPPPPRRPGGLVQLRAGPRDGPRPGDPPRPPEPGPRARHPPPVLPGDRERVGSGPRNARGPTRPAPSSLHGHALSPAAASQQARHHIGGRARHLERDRPSPGRDLGREQQRHGRHPPLPGDGGDRRVPPHRQPRGLLRLRHSGARGRARRRPDERDLPSQRDRHRARAGADRPVERVCHRGARRPQPPPSRPLLRPPQAGERALAARRGRALAGPGGGQRFPFRPSPRTAAVPAHGGGRGGQLRPHGGDVREGVRLLLARLGRRQRPRGRRDHRLRLGAAVRPLPPRLPLRRRAAMVHHPPRAEAHGAAHRADLRPGPGLPGHRAPGPAQRLRARSRAAGLRPLLRELAELPPPAERGIPAPHGGDPPPPGAGPGAPLRPRPRLLRARPLGPGSGGGPRRADLERHLQHPGPPARASPALSRLPTSRAPSHLPPDRAVHLRQPARPAPHPASPRASRRLPAGAAGARAGSGPPHRDPLRRGADRAFAPLRPDQPVRPPDRGRGGVGGEEAPAPAPPSPLAALPRADRALPGRPGAGAGAATASACGGAGGSRTSAAPSRACSPSSNPTVTASEIAVHFRALRGST
jgi:hypothetical protein